MKPTAAGLASKCLRSSRYASVPKELTKESAHGVWVWWKQGWSLFPSFDIDGNKPSACFHA